MKDLHWVFYHAGAAAGFAVAALSLALAMGQLRGTGRRALRGCVIGLVGCLGILAACILGMNLTA